MFKSNYACTIPAVILPNNLERVSLTTLNRAHGTTTMTCCFSDHSQCFLLETPYCLQKYSIQPYLKTITIFFFPKAPFFYPSERSRTVLLLHSLNSIRCTPRTSDSTNGQWNTGTASASSLDTLWDASNGNWCKVLIRNSREQQFSDNPLGNAL